MTPPAQEAGVNYGMHLTAPETMLSRATSVKP